MYSLLRVRNCILDHQKALNVVLISLAFPSGNSFMNHVLVLGLYLFFFFKHLILGTVK